MRPCSIHDGDMIDGAALRWHARAAKFSSSFWTGTVRIPAPEGMVGTNVVTLAVAQGTSPYLPSHGRSFSHGRIQPRVKSERQAVTLTLKRSCHFPSTPIPRFANWLLAAAWLLLLTMKHPSRPLKTDNSASSAVISFERRGSQERSRDSTRKSTFPCLSLPLLWVRSFRHPPARLET